MTFALSRQALAANSEFLQHVDFSRLESSLAHLRDSPPRPLREPSQTSVTSFTGEDVRQNMDSLNMLPDVNLSPHKEQTTSACKHYLVRVGTETLLVEASNISDLRQSVTNTVGSFSSDMLFVVRGANGASARVLRSTADLGRIHDDDVIEVFQPPEQIQKAGSPEQPKFVDEKSPLQDRIRALEARVQELMDDQQSAFERNERHSSPDHRERNQTLQSPQVPATQEVFPSPVRSVTSHSASVTSHGVLPHSISAILAVVPADSSSAHVPFNPSFPPSLAVLHRRVVQRLGLPYQDCSMHFTSVDPLGHAKPKVVPLISDHDILLLANEVASAPKGRMVEVVISDQQVDAGPATGSTYPVRR
jgi:hypothetical protein